MSPRLPDTDFVRLFEEMGPEQLARTVGVSVRSVFERRARLEGKLGREIKPPGGYSGRQQARKFYPHRIELEVINGHVLVGSDAHMWPGTTSTAWRAFVKMHLELKPKATILNGDVLDFASASRHPPIGWESIPTIQQEIEWGQEQLGEIERDKAKGSRLIWNLGNHDARFETRVATVAPEFAKVAGVHLHDHFPLWEPAWSTWINEDVVVKHRFKGGIHATHNNALWAGKTCITGHLHSAKVTPLTDYNGTRYGVDTGCLADTDHRAFVAYTEDNPKNWRSAFCLLTFKARTLMQPELVLVWDDNHVEFRGEILKV